MKKSIKKISCALMMTLGLSMLAGCGDKSVNQDDYIDKYAAYCDLGTYKGVEYEATKTEITSDMVQNQVNELLATYTVSENVTTGTAQNGDTVNIDFVGSIDGVEFAGGSTDGAGYTLTLGSGTMIAGFEEQIVGHNVGDVFNINVTFPEDYGSADLAGQDAVFEITINAKVVQTVPEYTDEFVANNTDYSTIAEYEQSIIDELTTEAAEYDSYYNKIEIMTVVVSNTTINEYPEKEMKELIDDTIADTTAEAEEYGYDLATFVTAKYGMASEESFRQYISGVVEDYMREKIVVCAIAKAENIRVTDAEIEAYREQMIINTGLTGEGEFDKTYSEEDVLYYTLSDKVSDFLLENSTSVVATTTDAQ